MVEHEHKYCPRCNAVFECKVGSIQLCQCSLVKLTENERDFIRKDFEDCLCNHCMKSLKSAYHKNIFQEKLKKILGVFYK